MAADFNAGSIEGTLDLDTRPFLAGLKYAKAKADEFSRDDVRIGVHLDDGKFDAEVDKTRAKLDRLGTKDARPKVKVDGIESALVKLKLLDHAINHTGLSVASVTARGLLMGSMFASVAAAALPLLGALPGIVTLGTAAGVAFGGAAIGLGLFAAVVKSVVTEITAANKKGKELKGWMGQAQSALKGLKHAWDDFKNSAGPETAHFLTVAFQGLASILPRLEPLLRTTAHGVTGVVEAVVKLTRQPIFSQFLSQLRSFMSGFLKGLGPALVDILTIFFHLFSVLQPAMRDIGRWTLEALHAFSRFVAGLTRSDVTGYVNRMLAVFTRFGNLVGDVFHTLGHLAAALGPLSGPALKFIDALVVGIGRLQLRPVAAALGQVLNAFRGLLPAVLDLVNHGLKALVPILHYIAVGLDWAKQHPELVKWILTLTLAVLGVAKATMVAYRAFEAIKALFTILTAASGIGLIVIGVLALAAALIYAYKHSETFRNIVNAAWRDVKAVSIDVYDWLKGPFLGFFIHTLPSAWDTTKRDTISAWNTVKNGILNPVQAVVHWFTGTFVPFFTRTIPNAFWTLVHDSENALSALKNAVLGAVRWLVDKFLWFEGQIIHAAAKAFGWIPGIGPKLRSASSEFDKFRARVNSALGAIQNKHVDIISSYHITGPFANQQKAKLAGMPGYASGFTVPKRGGAYSDYHPALLADGEEVITNRHGEADRFRAMGGQRMLRMANGGTVFDIATPGLQQTGNALVGFIHRVGASINKVTDSIKSRLDNWASTLFPQVPASGGSVGHWAPLIRRVLAMLGQPQSLLGAVEHRMNQESGGNARAINLWDVNAKNGDPSRGLMQVIGSTFNAYAGRFRGLGIYNPLANIYAGLNYALHAYPSLYYAMMKPGGYASGVISAAKGWRLVGERGAEFVNFGGGEQVVDHAATVSKLRAASRQAAQMQGAADYTALLSAVERLAQAVSRNRPATAEETAQAVHESLSHLLNVELPRAIVQTGRSR